MSRLPASLNSLAGPCKSTHFAEGKLRPRKENSADVMKDQVTAQTPAITPTSEQVSPALSSLLFHFKAQGFSLGLSEGRIWVCPLSMEGLGAQQDFLT